MKRSGKERKREEKRIIRRALADLSGFSKPKKEKKKKKFKAEWWAGEPSSPREHMNMSPVSDYGLHIDPKSLCLDDIDYMAATGGG